MDEGGKTMSEYVGLVKGKVHDRREISEYYCGGCGYPVTDHDSYCRECGGALHEGMGKSRWFELFGTPERAARTMAGKCGDCCECVLRGECSLEYCLLSCDGNAYRAKLLEWLRGDAK